MDMAIIDFFLNLIIQGVLAMGALWILFINIMAWKHNKDMISWWVLPFLYPIVVLGYLVDVYFNIVFGTVVFLELPKQLTLSERMREILKRPDRDYKFKISKFICRYLVEPHDPNHCGLDNIK